MFLDLQMSIKCPISKTKREQEAAARTPWQKQLLLSFDTDGRDTM